MASELNVVFVVDFFSFDETSWVIE